MNETPSLVAILVTAALTNNILLAKFLGIDVFGLFPCERFGDIP